MVVDGGLVGLYDIASAVPRQGHGERLCRALLALAQAQGARQAYLQVGSDNAVAQRLYARLGFRFAYRYHYAAPRPNCMSLMRLRRLAPATSPPSRPTGRTRGGPLAGLDALARRAGPGLLAGDGQRPALQPGRWSQLGIADPVSDALLGDVGLFVSADGQAAELGFSLAREAQGRGIASAVRAAVQRLLADTPVRVIHAQTDARNLACLRLLERLGAPRVARVETEFRSQPLCRVRYELARR
jgi:RimJ/RimL family protein N-acetyltransferase